MLRSNLPVNQITWADGNLAVSIEKRSVEEQCESCNHGMFENAGPGKTIGYKLKLVSTL